MSKVIDFPEGSGVNPWYELSKNKNANFKDVKDINITTDKITKRFDSINSVNFNENLLEDKKD